MEDSKEERAETQKNTDELLEDRKSDATDDETLREVEDSRRSDDSETDNKGALSPDGALDESKEIKDAGPM